MNHNDASARSRDRYTVHVVPHTHWDREWYLSYQNFRIRLVRLVDRLIRLLEEENYPSYHFDGQTIVLEDYLEVKPYRAETLRRLIAAGRLQVGPWYILPDEYLVSGESIIRNLLIGGQIAESFGGSTAVGYLPDIFGHISQMPQLLQGLGIDNIMLWRGISGEPDELKSEFVWEGPDGTRILANRLPHHAGYSNALNLPTEREALLARAAEELAIVESYATTSQLLFMNGTDHTMPQAELPQLLAWLNAHFGERYAFIPGTVGSYVEAVKRETGELATVAGELRRTNFARQGHHNFVLSQVLSSRIYLKLQNERAQTLLERWAEPWSVWASLRGYDYPRDLLRQSWKYLLQNHPHDSICGCSVDEVHDQNETRFAWSSEISAQLTHEAMRHLAAGIDTASVPADEIPLHVFNALPNPAGAVVEAQVLFPADASWRDLQVTDMDGHPLSAVVLDRRKRAVARHAYDQHPEIPYWQEALVRFHLADVPAHGYTTVRVKPRIRRTLWDSSLITAPGTMENGMVRLTVQPGGLIAVTDKETGRTYENLHRFEDGGDRGDGYIYSPPTCDEVLLTGAGECALSVAADTRDFATFRLEWNWRLPKALEPNRMSRSREKTAVTIVTEVTLRRDGKRIEFATTVDNRAKDHRLRVLFPTGLQAESAVAGGQFDMLERSIRVEQPGEEVWIEDAPTAFPMQGFVDVSEQTAGLAVLATGLPEYELLDDGERTVALTLLRAVGHLGSPDPLTINAGAGPAMETPGSQCLRKLEYRYALYPHGGAAGTDRLETLRQAEEHRVPLMAHQGIAGRAGELPASHGFLRLTDPALQVSALKRHETRDTAVLRVYNPTGRPVAAEAVFEAAPAEAHVCDLREERLHALPVRGHAVPIEAGPKRIVTIELDFGRV